MVGSSFDVAITIVRFYHALQSRYCLMSKGNSVRRGFESLRLHKTAYLRSTEYAPLLKGLGNSLNGMLIQLSRLRISTFAFGVVRIWLLRSTIEVDICEANNWQWNCICNGCLSLGTQVASFYWFWAESEPDFCSVRITGQFVSLSS